jgi:hypothetical protein
VSHPSALVGSAAYARDLANRFFTKYTRIDLREFEPHNHNLRNLIDSSQLEITFEGRPKGYKIPNNKFYKYEHSKRLVFFELDVRVIKRYSPPNTEYDYLEVDRTDYLPLLGCVQRHMEDMRISFRDPQ